MNTRGFPGCHRCPACAAAGTSEQAIAAHVMRHWDDEHMKLHDIYRNKRRQQPVKVPLKRYLGY